MKKTKISTYIICLIILIVSINIGTFFTNMLERIDVNAWLARGIGCSICVVIGLLFGHLWLRKDKLKEISNN